ncbi:butyrophilin subfamily 2 member A2-like [Hoplias malabaricus]|uniref:butyrophilin subfamily 2 member A2-like n=1 Tax=Hoplias malabaricus TaxID=27720 RepID=UPI0034635664
MLLLFIASVVACSATASDFSLLVPNASVSEYLGSSIILPCAISPSLNTESFEVRWYKSDYNKPVLLYRDLKVQDDSGDPQYRGRVSLIGQLAKGNVSLKLEKLTIADRGHYVCLVKTVTWYESANLNLIIKVMGSSPLFSLNEAGDQMNVTCSSDRWSPKPTLTWRDKEGGKLRHFHTYYKTDSEGLVSVSSWLLSPYSDLEWISCSVGLSDQNIKEGRVLPQKGIWKEAFISTLVLSLIIIIIFSFLLLLIRKGLFPHCSSHKNAKAAADSHESIPAETQPLKGVISESCAPPQSTDKILQRWKKVKNNKEKLTVDPDTRSVSLTIKKGGTGVFCGQQRQTGTNTRDTFPHVLSREEFSSGLKYWEVTVNSKNKDKLSWCVGVTQKPPTKETLIALCYEDHRGIYSSSKPHTQIPAKGHFIKLGLLLNFSEHTLSFFNVEEESHLHTFTINNMENKNYYALISPGIKDTLPVSFN